jgi:hypothetical protein
VKGRDYPVPKYDALTKCQKISTSNTYPLVMIIGLSIAATFIFIGLIVIVYKIIRRAFKNKIAHTAEVE